MTDKVPLDIGYPKRDREYGENSLMDNLDLGGPVAMGGWNTMGMDLLDEERAHKWADRVSGSTDSWTKDAINYYRDIKKLPTASRNVTDHWLKYDGCNRSNPPKYDANGVFRDGYRTIRKPVSL